MTAGPAMGRQYRLHLTVTDNRVSAAHVACAGPVNPLVIGEGRSIREALHLAGLLFPLCPAAHKGAALRAVEQAAGVALPPGQRTAREAVLLAEAVSGTVWRAAMQWRTLLGDTPDPAPVRLARDGAASLARALFTEDWVRPGGAPLAADGAAAQAALRMVTHAFNTIQGTAETVRTGAMAVRLADGAALCPPLGATVFQSDLDPDDTQCEETPRSLHPDGTCPQTLADWFAAQHAHGSDLLEQLSCCLDQVQEDGPIPMPDDMTGQGLGVAMTARGRLRHCLRMDRGRIVAWRAAAPTDWNFAPQGAAARAALTLDPGEDFVKQAQWFVQAFDPCAPCAVVMEAGHA